MTPKIHCESSVFVILSFEGPDSYSLAGGLGVRASKLATALAEMGYETHLFFVGDPGSEGISEHINGYLILHRWCQWISQYHPNGVYEGEEGKLNDLTHSLPGYLVENLVRPASEEGKQLVIMAEEWHTAESLCRTSELLAQQGLRNRALFLWNANNTFSFHRIDWARLQKNAVITTVSRYMQHLMRPYGVEPLVLHNGIHREMTEPLDTVMHDGFEAALEADFTLFKMARFDPAKGWMPAIESAARLKDLGYSVTFFMRGGMEPFGKDVLERSTVLGLSVQDVSLYHEHPDDNLRELLSAQNTDIVNIRSFISHDLSRILFACSDAVLANSGHEPFGLVGLEAMASGGAAYVGTTGEDYAQDFQNCVILETSKAEEAVASMLFLRNNREFQAQLRSRAQSTAQEFTWSRVIENKILPKLECLDWERRIP